MTAGQWPSTDDVAVAVAVVVDVVVVFVVVATVVVATVVAVAVVAVAIVDQTQQGWTLQASSKG